MSKSKTTNTDTIKSDLSFDFGVSNAFELDFSMASNMPERYAKPLKIKEMNQSMIKYDNAELLAKNINFEDTQRYFVLCSGAFIFGDFLEALIVENDYGIDELTISSLSFSQDNINSLANLLNGGYIKKLRMFVSCYFWGFKSNKDLIKYAYMQFENFDFDIIVSQQHTKMSLIKTDCGKYIICHGSANLRSSGCIEQFSIENNQELYNFNKEYFNSISLEYSAVKKPLTKSNKFNRKEAKND